MSTLYTWFFSFISVFSQMHHFCRVDCLYLLLLIEVVFKLSSHSYQPQLCGLLDFVFLQK